MEESLNFGDVHPDAVDRFRPFAHEVLALCGGTLHSLHLTGSAVTPEYVPGRSDINSVVVFHRMDLGLVERLAPLGKRFGRRKVSPPLLMTPEYVAASLDVFPVEFLNIRLAHRTLAGEDLFRDLSIHPGHLRLACEREIKARLIGLRQGYLASRGEERVLNEEFSRAISGYIPVFRGIIRLYGEEPALGFDPVIDQLGRLTGVETEPFRRALEQRRGRGRLDMTGIKRLFEDFYAATDRLGSVVDAIAA